MKVVVLLILVVALALYFMPAAVQLGQAKDVVGIGFSPTGAYLTTDGSPSYLGGTTGYLEPWNGHPNRLSRVCDHNHNLINDKQAIYKRTDSGHLKAVNFTVDKNGASVGCGTEVLNKSRAAHRTYAARFGTLSIHVRK